MMKRIFVILVCIFVYSTNAQVFGQPPPPPLSKPHIVSVLYEKVSPLDYHSVWSSSSTGTYTYIAGLSSESKDYPDYPDAPWAAKQMFIVKYDNETMLPVKEKTFPMTGYPYFVEEVSGELYVGGIFNAGTNWRGFIYVLDTNFDKVRSYIFEPYVLSYDFTIDDNGDIYAIGSRWVWGQGYNVFIKKFHSDLTPYSTPDLVLAGDMNDYGWDIKYNAADDNMYIAGYTEDGISGFSNSPGDSYFVARCDKDLDPVNSLVYVGGSGDEFYNDFEIVINGATDKLYLGAGTESTNMPNRVNTLKGDADAFVSMIDISGPLSVEKTLYLGGTGSEIMRGDISAGNNPAYLYYAGYTTSTDFEEVPVSAVQNYNAGGNDIFITKVRSDLSGAIATYIGGKEDDIAFAFSAPDGSPYLFAAGFTFSSFFPDDLSPSGELSKTVTQAAVLTRIDSIMAMKGDANNDDCVTGLDYGILTKYLASNNFTLDNWQFFALDLDEDGDLDEDDQDILHDIKGPCPNSN